MRGPALLLLLTLNLVFWATLVLLLGVLKLVIPKGRARRRVVLTLAAMGDRWSGGNNRIIDALLPIRWHIEMAPALRRHGHYLLFANHISWADILVIFRAFHGRVAFIRFFIKRELAWLPFVGQAAWALEFPFMKRYTSEYLARHPEKRGSDLETTRRACERYRTVPMAILNFLEGTRFTRQKHDEQGAPYRYLLRPRSGGASFVLASLGDQLDAVLDVTIAYPGHLISAWQFISGRVREVRVSVRRLEVPSEFLGLAVVEGETRDRFRTWIEAVWREKDDLLAASTKDFVDDTKPFV